MSWIAADLESLLSVVAASVDATGRVLHANAGFRKLISKDRLQRRDVQVAEFFSHPSLATLLAAPSDAAGKVRDGLLTVVDFMGRTHTLRGQVWREGDGLRLLAEYDIEDLKLLSDTVSDLNRDHVRSRLELAQTNLKIRSLNEELEKREAALIQRKLELQDLYRTLQTLREDERTRIARELHDGTGHLLTAMLMDLAWIDARLPKDGSPISSKLVSVVTLSEQVVDSIRSIMEDLRPSILDELGLVTALEGFVNGFATRTGIRCDLLTSGEHLKLGDGLATDVFRIVQEALNNVVMHANATHASVSLARTKHDIVLVIQDDGIGLDEIVKNGQASFGIRGMHERVSMLGGTFTVTNEPGQRVRLEAVIPANQASVVE